MEGNSISPFTQTHSLVTFWIRTERRLGFWTRTLRLRVSPRGITPKSTNACSTLSRRAAVGERPETREGSPEENRPRPAPGSAPRPRTRAMVAQPRRRTPPKLHRTAGLLIISFVMGYRPRFQILFERLPSSWPRPGGPFPPPPLAGAAPNRDAIPGPLLDRLTLALNVDQVLPHQLVQGVGGNPEEPRGFPLVSLRSGKRLPDDDLIRFSRSGTPGHAPGFRLQKRLNVGEIDRAPGHLDRAPVEEVL